MKNNIKNFYRIKDLLFKKCKEINPLFGIVSPSFLDFISADGQKLFETKGQEVYLKTARFYWNLLTKKNK